MPNCFEAQPPKRAKLYSLTPLDGGARKFKMHSPPSFVDMSFKSSRVKEFKNFLFSTFKLHFSLPSSNTHGARRSSATVIEGAATHTKEIRNLTFKSQRCAAQLIF